MSDGEYAGQRDELVSKAKEMAEAHWKWVEKICHIMYVDAMVHGYIHGREDHKTEDTKE